MKIETHELQAPRQWKLSQLRFKIVCMLVRRGAYGVAEVATDCKRAGITIRSTLSPYDARLEKQPELRQGIEKSTKIV